MSIKAIIPEGLTEITVNGLHQWDYGQQLEVTCEGLPPLVEVHFACSGMSEAVVRSCSVSALGVLTAAIPDRCLEQSAPVYAWVVVIGASSGTTVLQITLPIIERPRPEVAASLPEEIVDKYTESIAVINSLVDSLKTGDVVVKNALQATNANYATSAGSATRAGSAQTADSPSEGGNFITTKTLVANYEEYELLGSSTIPGGIYMCILGANSNHQSVVLLDTQADLSSVYYEPYEGVSRPHRLRVCADSVTNQRYVISKEVLGEQGSWVSIYDTDGTIKYRELARYPVG